MNYDVVIMVVPRTFEIIGTVIAQIRKHLDYQRIVLIGKSQLKDEAIKVGCDFIDEDQILNELTFFNVKEAIKKRDHFAIARTGWYFQQFLKCAYARICGDEYYLVWDADLIPLRDITFFDGEGHPFFDTKTEYHRPYYTTIRKLFDDRVKKTGLFSYISEHMIIKKEIMNSMVAEIENSVNIAGGSFWEKVLNSVNPIDLAFSGFSEFETYGCYVDTFYPQLYKKRQIRSLREGDFFLSSNPTPQELEWAGQSFDLINLEHRNERLPEIAINAEKFMDENALFDVAKSYGFA